MTAALKFEINGQMVAPDDASWYLYAPCGCCSGVSLAIRHEGEIIGTEEQAWREWEPNAEQRRRQRAAGFTTVIGLRSEARERVALDCPHTPKWGVEKTPVPAGYRWAAPVERARRQHLVSGTFDDREWLYGGDATVLCDSKAGSWMSRRSMLFDLPECTRCVKAAKALASSSPVTDTEANRG